MKKFYILFIIHYSFLITNAQWQSDVRLTNNPAASNLCFNNAKSISANGSSVYTVWEDLRDGNREIYFKKSTDNGVVWGADVRLTNDPSQSWYPTLSVNGNYLNVSWQENRDGNYEIYYKRSSDGGSAWGADTRMTNNT